MWYVYVRSNTYIAYRCKNRAAATRWLNREQQEWEAHAAICRSTHQPEPRLDYGIAEDQDFHANIEQLVTLRNLLTDQPYQSPMNSAPRDNPCSINYWRLRGLVDSCPKCGSMDLDYHWSETQVESVNCVSCGLDMTRDVCLPAGWGHITAMWLTRRREALRSIGLKLLGEQRRDQELELM